MDDRRFDDLTRALAGGITRRGLLRGALAASFGLALGQRSGAAACPPDQVRRRGIGCVCKATGRPPDANGWCPCASGLTRCGDACLDIDGDVANCGACGQACPASPDPCLVAVCRGGACGVKPRTDGAACGACHACDATTGACLPVNDGAPCTGDGDRCFGAFACQGGACVGSAPVACAALDQCHEAGTCDPATGLCSNPTKADGTACDDGNACTADDRCRQGVCTGASVACDDGLACTDDACDPATGCAHVLRPGFCLIAGTCYAAAERNPANPCQRCDPAQADDAWSNAPLGTACDDATRCNGREACDGAGACQPGIPVSCPPPDACQDDGVCDPETGDCAYAPKGVGTVCRAATGPCQADAVCDGTNPGCPPNEIAVGRTCDDGDPCTEDDVCRADGACAGTPIGCDDGLTCTDDTCDPDLGCIHSVKTDSCLIEGACYAAGELNPENTCQRCEPTRNQRRWTPLDGVPCGDGACLTGATCVSGFCTGGEATTEGCAIGGVCYPAGATRPSDSCHVCDPARSQSMWSLQTDGASCAGLCRTGGTCQAGNCAGGTVAAGFCHIEGLCIPAGETHPSFGPCVVCDPARHAESWTTLADGAPCPNLCLANPTCQAGVCAGEEAVVCAQPPDRAFCQRAACDPATGACVVQPTRDLRGDTKGCEVCQLCVGGACIGGILPVDCGPCGACDPDTFVCAPKPAGADCGSDCTTRRSCDSAGSCVEELGGCFNVACEARVCDPATQQCVETGANDGKPCDPDNPCRECRGGTCQPKKCGACQRCDPASGQCVACEPCCNGVCGQTACGDDCCSSSQACCSTSLAGLQICLSPDRVCMGTCYSNPVTCCGRFTCDPDEICCPAAEVFDPCCDAASEICGPFGCVSRA